ncbi:hypothetical protein PsorP6_018070 [Peronosclerospora sorghi]|uniref:Uncharacterized protein n=1 Tax=Peronosclerospora sorghi TaxID=230839 RepID=A0ACC0WF95_9STRA|nr:hypothetical protein PsorP6_018070 [Peronosclerospora sorghi]
MPILRRQHVADYADYPPSPQKELTSTGKSQSFIITFQAAKSPPKTRKIKSTGCDDVILPIKNGEHSESHIEDPRNARERRNLETCT